MDDLNNLTDEELVTRCLALGSKDERPFASLFQRHHTFVTRVLYRYFPHEQDVEDLVQEVFFKAYRSLKEFQGRSSFKTWMFSIATNTAKNEIRKRIRRPEVLDDSLQEYSEVLPDDQESQPQHHFLRKQAMQEAFAQLNEHEQEILLLKDAQELTYEEVAQLLNLSVSATKMRVQRARLVFKSYYQD